VTVSELTEQELISRIKMRLAPQPPWLLVGIGDDAAVVEPVRNQVEVVTVDAIVEGVHFDRRFTPPAAIGRRALAVNLSDLAAMGATPRLALLSMALPAELPCDDFDAIADGFAALAAAHQTYIAGGNLTRSPGPLMIDVTAIGWTKRRHVLTRSGAKPGDGIYLTGCVGGALAGLQVLRDATQPASQFDSCVTRYLYPQARVKAGVLLGRNRAATACMDLSDGLADGIRQIAEASGVGATIDRAAIPVDPEARTWFESRRVDPVMTALGGGDDYELVFTASPKSGGRLRAVARHGGVGITRIGSCTKGSTVELTDNVNGEKTSTPLPRGFGHFR
jgi:thiamine-monophosphate kinase